VQTYASFQPTGFDARGFMAEDIGPEDCPDVSDWFVLPVSQTRDSGCFGRCNFETALRMVRDADPDGTDHVSPRFGHWGPGWFEIILVRPGSPACKIAEEIEASLEDYPSLDDDKLSEMEWDEATRYWSQMSVRERVETIQRCPHSGASIFAARRDEIPEDQDGSLFDCLRSC